MTKNNVTYRKYWSFYCLVNLVVICLSGGCSTPPESAQEKNPRFQVNTDFKPESLKITKPIDFKMAPPEGRIEETHIYSKSRTTSRSQGQLLHEREESVDFTVKSKVVNADKKNGTHRLHVETLRKDGPTDLYDLGYPEVGEVIDYILTQKAQVKKAGLFPSNSLFFLPPVSLPKKPVEVGDTWAFKADWVSLRNGMPLTVELVSIFKNVYLCGEKGQCAEIELSGHVHLPETIRKRASVESTIEGRLLYKLDTGTIVWSYVRNHEKIMNENDEMEIYACTETVLSEPEKDRWPWRVQTQCDPSQVLPLSVPGVY